MIKELPEKMGELLSELGRLQKKNLAIRRDIVARGLTSGDSAEQVIKELNQAEIMNRVNLIKQMSRIEYKLRMDKDFQEMMGLNVLEQSGMTNYLIGRRLLELYERLRVRAEVWNAGRKERQEIEGLFYALSYYMERATDEMEKLMTAAAEEKAKHPNEDEMDPIMQMLEAGKPEHHIYRLYNGRIQ